ncbi:Histamine H2 receptor, partial [Lamellibrachia satsuma]
TVLMLFMTVGNGLMIVVLSTRRQLKSVTNMFVISLSASDLLVGLLVIPINFVIPTSLFNGYTTCIYCASATLTLCLASIANIFAVTIDRYIAIVDPLKYPVRMTRRRASTAIAFVWTYAAVLGLLPVFGWRSNHSTCTRGETYSLYYVLVVVASGFIVPLWGTGALYWRILSEARRHLRIPGPLAKLVRPLSLRRNVPGTETGVSRKRKFVTVAIMLVYFELSWLPVFVSMLIDVFINPRWLPAWVHWVIGVLAFINCAVDPIIYGYRNKDIR